VLLQVFHVSIRVLKSPQRRLVERRRWEPRRDFASYLLPVISLTIGISTHREISVNPE
jgi:hypothetical protein